MHFGMLEFGSPKKRAITSTIHQYVKFKALQESGGPRGEQHQVSILHCSALHKSFHMPWVSLNTYQEKRLKDKIRLNRIQTKESIDKL